MEELARHKKEDTRAKRPTLGIGKKAKPNNEKSRLHKRRLTFASTLVRSTNASTATVKL